MSSIAQYFCIDRGIELASLIKCIMYWIISFSTYRQYKIFGSIFSLKPLSSSSLQPVWSAHCAKYQQCVFFFDLFVCVSMWLKLNWHLFILQVQQQSLLNICSCREGPSPMDKRSPLVGTSGDHSDVWVTFFNCKQNCWSSNSNLSALVWDKFITHYSTKHLILSNQLDKK